LVTAAAQEVFVDLPMDGNLDWSTLELGEIAFGDHIDMSLSGKSHGKASYAMPGTNTFVKTEVTAKNGVLSWYMRDWDPTTADNFPASATGGFLPPNDPETHCGEGHLSYRVRVKSDAPNGAIIRASAQIVFDSNPMIETDPSWWNTVATIHDVSIELDGVATNLTLVAGEPFGELPAPTQPRTGYTFDAWYTGENGTGTKATPTAIVPEGEFTLYDNWTANPYKVRFNANGGTGTMPDQSFVYGKAQKLSANAFTRKMHSFVGWSRSAGGNVEFTDGQSVGSLASAANSVVTLYAVWESSMNVLWPSGVDGVAPASAASEYNGYLYDAKSGAVKGTIQVKVGKPGKKDGKASVSATVVVGAKKFTLKASDKGKAVMASDGPTEIELVGKGAEACTVTLGADGISGYYGRYLIDGSRNFFSSKDKGEVADANDAISKWLGSMMVVWNGGSLSVSIAAKGKVKVSGTLADGRAKVSVSTVLLVGEEWCCASVAASKANLSFVLWLSRDGETPKVEGLGDEVHVGKPGTLVDGAAFRIDADEFAAVFGQEILPYLPDGVPVTKKGTKWTLPKAGKIAMKKGVVDGSKAGDNPSGLKLTYKAKDGTFKGSFKVYVENKGKLKSTTVNVTGFLLNGIGFGTATIKNVGSVAVTIE